MSAAEQGDKDLQAIQDLSQQLETLFKEMQQIRRENLLFESYLSKMDKINVKEDENQDKKNKKDKTKKDKPPEKKSLVLTPQQKFEIAQYESERLKSVIEQCRVKSDAALQTLKAILEQTDMSIAEIRKDAYDFQREILMGGENSRTGKIEAERIEKYFQQKQRQKQNLIKKYKAKRQTLANSITKTQKQIQKKQVQGDELKFIDYHQLQIENKKYVKQIEQKNKKLLILKIVSGKIGAQLLRKKKELSDAIKKIDEADRKTDETVQSIQKSKKLMLELEEQRDKKYIKKKKLQMQSEQMMNSKDKIPDTMNYVKLKLKQEKLLYQKKNLERKINIARGIYEKAKSYLAA